ncbi:hypothetical protein Tco_0286185 [Tanacetum coccineum]
MTISKAVWKYEAVTVAGARETVGRNAGSQSGVKDYGIIVEDGLCGKQLHGKDSGWSHAESSSTDKPLVQIPYDTTDPKTDLPADGRDSDSY